MTTPQLTKNKSLLDDGDYHLLLLDVIYARDKHFEITGGLKLRPFALPNYEPTNSVIVSFSIVRFFN